MAGDTEPGALVEAWLWWAFVAFGLQAALHWCRAFCGTAAGEPRAQQHEVLSGAATGMCAVLYQAPHVGPHTCEAAAPFFGFLPPHLVAPWAKSFKRLRQRALVCRVTLDHRITPTPHITSRGGTRVRPSMCSVSTSAMTSAEKGLR